MLAPAKPAPADNNREGGFGPRTFTLKLMTEQNKPRKSRAKKPATPKVEAPKVEEPKVEEPKAVEPKVTANPVKVEEPKRMKLEAYERPETNQHEGESKWVDPNHGITQHRFGMGRLKHRMRTRKSRYEQ